MASFNAMPSWRPRVLLADDYPDMVKAVSRLLALDCDVVGSVVDGNALMDAAQRLQPDVIVLDLHLPNVDGLELCHRITQAHPGMKVVVFTAMHDADITERALAVGAAACVSKTAQGDLLSAIRRLSGGEGQPTAL
jgi:DNA-binding NarL/FixJ family response regulator